MTHRHLVVPGYAIALLLIVVPLADYLLTVWPPSPGVSQWRVGAVGMFSRALMTPGLGLFLLLALGTVQGHRWALRLTSAVGAVAAIGLLALGVLFVLDFLETRAGINPQAKAPYDVSSLTAFLKLMIWAGVGALFAWAGWKGNRRTGRGKEQADAPPIVRHGG